MKRLELALVLGVLTGVVAALGALLGVQADRAMREW